MQHIQPYPTSYTSVQMYKYLVSPKQRFRTLSFLRIELGGSRTINGSYAPSWFFWEKHSRKVLEVTPAERYEHAQAGLLNVTDGFSAKCFICIGMGDTDEDKRLMKVHERETEAALDPSSSLLFTAPMPEIYNDDEDL